MSRALLFLLSILLAIVYGFEVPRSPCPMFRYVFNQSSYSYYGELTLAKHNASFLDLEVNMTINAEVPPNNNIKLVVLSRQVDIIHGDFIVYGVLFPVRDPLPRLTLVKFNKQHLCRGDPDPLLSGVPQTAMWSKVGLKIGVGEYSSTYGPPAYDPYSSTYYPLYLPTNGPPGYPNNYPPGYPNNGPPGYPNNGPPGYPNNGPQGYPNNAPQGYPNNPQGYLSNARSNVDSNNDASNLNSRVQQQNFDLNRNSNNDSSNLNSRYQEQNSDSYRNFNDDSSNVNRNYQQNSDFYRNSNNDQKLPYFPSGQVNYKSNLDDRDRYVAPGGAAYRRVYVDDPNLNQKPSNYYNKPDNARSEHYSHNRYQEPSPELYRISNNLNDNKKPENNSGSKKSQ